jgi:hypothetical protein
VKSVLSNIWKEGGVRAFFRGNGTNCIKIIPESSLKFFIYEKAKSTIVNRKNNSDITDIERFFAGATAGALSQMLIYPLECIKVVSPLSLPFFPPTRFLFSFVSLAPLIGALRLVLQLQVHLIVELVRSFRLVHVRPRAFSHSIVV